MILKNRKAFTLIEILISIAIISSMLTPIVMMISFTKRGSIRSNNMFYSVTLAEQKLEQYKFIGFKILKKKLENIYLYDNSENVETVFVEEEEDYGEISGFSMFSRYTRIKFFIPEGEKEENYDRRIKIEVVVKWKEYGNNEQVEKMQNFIALVSE